MTLSNRSAEIRRLLKAFEVEASKFPDLHLSVWLITRAEASGDPKKASSPNHAVMLWQYYGLLGGDGDITQRLLASLQASNLRLGIKGAELSSFAVLEGQACDLFVKMAKRAGSLFDEEEAETISSRVVMEILQRERGTAGSGKPVAVTNNNPLALWLNYLLYHLSMTNPGREHTQPIDLDPFALSLLALERLMEDQTVGKSDRSTRNVAEIAFRVAMSFPGERRPFVAEVVRRLRQVLGQDSIFYDHDYQAQLARPNLDTLLQDIYRNRSDLVVVFLCAEYAAKQWCGLEWRVVRDIIKSKEDNRIMFVRFDDAQVDGVLSIDGYVDARACGSGDVARFIFERLSQLPERR